MNWTPWTRSSGLGLGRRGSAPRPQGPTPGCLRASDPERCRRALALVVVQPLHAQSNRLVANLQDESNHMRSCLEDELHRQLHDSRIAGRLVIVPNAAEPNVPFGAPSGGVLVRLNTSARSSAPCSRGRGNRRMTARSRLR